MNGIEKLKKRVDAIAPAAGNPPPSDVPTIPPEALKMIGDLLARQKKLDEGELHDWKKKHGNEIYIPVESLKVISDILTGKITGKK
jgi:hypothetical protein